MNRQAYFLEQLCTIGMAGLYGGVMAAMYWSARTARPGQQTLLSILVGWIQHVVLAASVLLLILAVIRAIGVWRASGQIHEPEHDHDHGHSHDHAHDHGHDHGHSHDWSPWRYVFLVIPLLLIFLGLDYNELIANYQMKLADKSGRSQTTSVPGGAGESLSAIGVLSIFPSPMEQAWANLVCQYGLADGGGGLQTAIDLIELESSAPPDTELDVGTLETVGVTEDQRNLYRSYKRVQTEGFYNPIQRPDGRYDPRLFQVVRFRMACCIGDARPSSVVARSQKVPIDPETKNIIQQNSWIKVQGRLDFVQHEGRWRPVMRALRVIPSVAPTNPYLN